jgi:hypothetical protein
MIGLLFAGGRVAIALGGALVGGVAGFVAGDGVEGASRAVQWVVIGGVVYAVYTSGAFRK